MGTTPKFGWPIPEFGDLADAPQALSNLANAIEADMTGHRLWTAYRENAGTDGSSGSLANPGGTATALSSRPVPLAAVGWATIDVTATIVQETGSGAQNWAGYMFAYLNGALCGSGRFHSHSVTRHLTGRVWATILLPKTLTAFQLQVTTSCDSLSQNAIRVIEVDANINQYGTLRT